MEILAAAMRLVFVVGSQDGCAFCEVRVVFHGSARVIVSTLGQFLDNKLVNSLFLLMKWQVFYFIYSFVNLPTFWFWEKIPHGCWISSYRG
jgi:hypothetical protein